VVGAELGNPGEPVPHAGPEGLVDPHARAELQQAMTEGAGVLRSADSLATTGKVVDDLLGRTTDDAGPDSWETTNLATIAAALLAAAGPRTETRGCHWREDFPTRDDTRWRVRLRSRLMGGRLVTDVEDLT
jgi:L-aspartate oxidase